MRCSVHRELCVPSCILHADARQHAVVMLMLFMIMNRDGVCTLKMGILSGQEQRRPHARR